MKRRDAGGQIGTVEENGRLLSLELCEKQYPRYDFQEPLILLITAQAYRDIEDISFRIELSSNDGAYIGSVFAESVGSLKKEEPTQFTLLLHARNIIPGSYLGTVVLYQKTPYQASVDLDFVEKGFRI